MINKRLRMDCLLTDQGRHGRKALHKRLVENTWWGTLRNQWDLQEDWTKFSTGVLVGIGEHPPGRNH